jgi:RND family efflux transporter MFP subunit
MRWRGGLKFVVLVAAALVSACRDQPTPVPEAVRPIRTFTVTEVAEGQVRRFSGVIEARDTSSLSFQVGGNVRRVLVNQGDRVRAGQVLAELDPEPYRLNVQAADADLQRARAVVAQTRADFERNRRLVAERAVSQVQFEISEREYYAALSRIDYATARLNLAERDLRNTALAAPFAGSIASRLVDPFVEVQAGQKVFQLDAEGGLQAAIAVPETSIAQVTLGMPATVTLPQLAQPMTALVSEIGSAATQGNAFPVKAALVSPPPAVRSGMTAEVQLILARDQAQTSYLVPLTAIAAGDQPGHGFVFIYDPATSTVGRTAVRSSGPLVGNMVSLTGVALGDVVASAGANLLVDGQRVRLMAQAAPPPGR